MSGKAIGTDELVVRDTKFLDADENIDWEKIYDGTVIGYQKIIPVFRENVKEVKILIRDFRVLPLLSFVGIYQDRGQAD